MQTRALSNRAIALLIATGLVTLVGISLPWSAAFRRAGYSGFDLSAQRIFSFPPAALGVLVPTLVGGLLAALGELPAVRRLFVDAPLEGIARIVFVFACMNQLLVSGAFAAHGVGAFDPHGISPIVSVSPSFAFWWFWFGLGVIGFLLFGAHAIPALRAVSPEETPTWVAVPSGTLDILGDPVPSGQWMRLMRHSAQELVLSTVEGLTYRIDPSVDLHTYEGETPR